MPRWLVVLAAVVIAGGCGYYTMRAVSQTHKYTRDQSVSRDFDHFYHAAVAGAAGDDPYESFRKGYIYPPLLAAAMRPLAELDRNPAYLVWFGVNSLILGGAFVISARTLLERFGIEPRAGLVTVVVAAGMLPAIDQLRWQLEQGQTDGLLLLAFALGLRWMGRRPILAGLLCGLGANVKYLSMVVIPFAGVRARWRLGIGTLLGIVGGLLLPALVFGWGRNAGFVRTSIGRLVHVVDEGPDLVNTGGVNVHSLTWELNISMPAMAAKLTERLDLPGIAVPALAVAFAGLLVGVGWWMYTARGFRFWRGGRAGEPAVVRGERGVFEWLGLVVLAMAMSPQVTVRHMVLMTLLYQCAAVLALAPRPGAPRWLPLAGVGAAWLGMTMPPGGGDTWSSEVALPVWRSVSGAMWCALLCYAALLWTGLAYVRAGRGDPAEGGAQKSSESSASALIDTPM